MNKYVWIFIFKITYACYNMDNLACTSSGKLLQAFCVQLKEKATLTGQHYIHEKSRFFFKSAQQIHTVFNFK